VRWITCSRHDYWIGTWQYGHPCGAAYRGLAPDRRPEECAGHSCLAARRIEAQRLGIPLTTLEEHPVIDLTIDGADEVNPDLDLIKGGGGALLYEKIIAQVTRREIIVVDESKLSPALSTRSTAPVEVIPFGWRSQSVFLETLGARPTLRRNADGTPFVSRPGQLHSGLRFRACDRARRACRADQSAQRDCGAWFFSGHCAEVIVAGVQGVRLLKRENSPHKF